MEEKLDDGRWTRPLGSGEERRVEWAEEEAEKRGVQVAGSG